LELRFSRREMSPLQTLLRGSPVQLWEVYLWIL
jgi:hypothetical protein